MAKIHVLPIVLAMVALAPAATARAQAPESPEAMLSAMIGTWYFEERALSPDLSYVSAGTRTFTRTSANVLQWVDELQTGRTNRGALRYEADRSIFQYVFERGSGEPCMVEGAMVGDGRIHFTRTGTCPGLVLESDLVVVSDRLHTYSRSDGAFVAFYTRQDLTGE